MTLEKKSFLNWKWLLNILLPLAVAFIPVSEAFTADIRNFFIITLFAIILIATDNIPIMAASIALPVIYMIFLPGMTMKIVFDSWSTATPWLTLGGSILTIALTKTGLLKRIAYKCILLCGGKFRGILYGMMLIGIVISSFMADVPAKGILMGTLALGICNALGFKLGGRASSAIGLAAIAACLGPSYLYFTGAGGTIVPMNAAQVIWDSQVAAGMTPLWNVPSWGEYFIHMALPQLIYTIITVVIIDLFFKPDQEVNAVDFLKGELKGLGNTSTSEKKLIAICLALVTAIATSSFHGIPAWQCFILTAVILMCPGINIITQEDTKKANYSAIYFITACMTIGTVSNNLGVGKFIADMVQPFLDQSIYHMFGGLWFTGFFANMALTPTAAYTVFTSPIIELSTATGGLGLNPIPVLYGFSHSLEQVLFPYEYVPALLIFSTGMISMKNFIKYNAMRALTSLLCVFLIFIPWWSMIGLLWL